MKRKKGRKAEDSISDPGLRVTANDVDKRRNRFVRYPQLIFERALDFGGLLPKDLQDGSRIGTLQILKERARPDGIDAPGTR